MTEGITWMIDNHSIPCKQISAMRAINMLHAGKFFMFFVCLLIFFEIIIFENYFRNTIEVSNNLDPDQARRSVWPDLATNCLQRLSAKLSLTGRELRTEREYLNYKRKQMVKTSCACYSVKHKKCFQQNVPYRS